MLAYPALSCRPPEWRQVGQSYRHDTVKGQYNCPIEDRSRDPLVPGIVATLHTSGEASRTQQPRNTPRVKAVDFFGYPGDSVATSDDKTDAAPMQRDSKLTGETSSINGDDICVDGGGTSKGDVAIEVRRNAINSIKIAETRERKRKTTRSSSPSPSDDNTDSGQDINQPDRKKGLHWSGKGSGKDRSRRREDSRAPRKSKKSAKGLRSGKSHRQKSSAKNGSAESSSEESSGNAKRNAKRSSRRSKVAVSGVQQLFVEDRRGDKDTALFGGFYRLNVPVYHGMNKAKAGRRGERHQNDKPERAPRYFGNQARDASSSGQLARVQLWKGDKRKYQAMLWNHGDGSTLGSTGENSVLGQKQRESVDFLPVDPVAESLNGHTASQDPAEKQEGVHTESLEQWVTRRTKEFNVMTRKRPESEALWLQFADFQQEAVWAVHGGGFSSQSPSAVIIRMTLEKQASVLEGAVRSNPSSIRLKIEQLRLAEQLQEHDVVDALWRRAIEESNHSKVLWLRYLELKSRHFTSFSVMNQRSTYARCIRALKSEQAEMRKKLEKEQRAKGVFIMGERSMMDDYKEFAFAEKDLLDVIWNYCTMEKAAGYQERALGVLQALVELNIQPGGTTMSMEEFESFWDSEAPRIGDAHPSLAGMSWWLTTTSAARVKSPGQTPKSGRERVEIARKAPISRPPGIRGKRKRAIDFFDSELSASTSHRQPDNAQLEELGKTKEAHVPDVLDKAYHAAMALSAVPHSNSSPPVKQIADKVNKSLAETSALRLGSHLHEGHVLEKAASRSEVKDTDSNIGSSTQIAIPGQEKEKTEPMKQDGQGAASSTDTRAVDAEGLIWVDKTQTTAYSVRHGYRIDVQGAQDSVSGLEYSRILSQMRGTDAAEGHLERDVQAAAAASKRLRSRGARQRDAESAKQAAALESVLKGDVFSVWAKTEDTMMRHQWQPLRAAEDGEGAEEQPDRVVFVEDLRPFLFILSQPASLRFLINFFLTAGGLVFPRSGVSHCRKSMSEACQTGSIGDGGLSGNLISTMSNGLQAVWSASGGDLPVSGKSVNACTDRQEPYLSALKVSTTADQFLLLTDEVIRDVPRQTFIRNVLHHLVRAPELLGAVDSRHAASSGLNARGAHGSDILVQLQCTLMMFEGNLSSAAGARHGQTNALGASSETVNATGRTGKSWSDEDIHGHEARKVAKSLLEASQASATDLRLWSSYVQLLALLGNRQEATKVAEKALSMVQALPDDKKPLSAELFWLAFRLHAGLPLSPHDPHSRVGSTPGKSDPIGGLFEPSEKINTSRKMAIHVLCSFAEGSFKRPKTKKTKREGLSSSSDATAVKPPRIMAARRLMADHVARIAVELQQKGTGGKSNRSEGALDMTPSFMYYSVARVWLEHLIGGQDEAEKVMRECLDLAQGTMMPTETSRTGGISAQHGRNLRLGETIAGNKPYKWEVVPEDGALGVCLERMYRAFSELLVLAQRYNPVSTGPRRVREVLLRGLQSFPAEPGMLAMLLEAEQFSGSQQRLVHHQFEVSRRRALTWEQGPTSPEWIFTVTHQVMRCVHEARQSATASRAQMDGSQAAAPKGKHSSQDVFNIKNWLPGSYARLKRSLEAAVSHPTGRVVPLLWRIYSSLEAMRGDHIEAKQLFWRAVHACPGNKAVWMDALRGNEKTRIGVAGLRPVFRAKELNEIVDAISEKSLHLRAELP